MAAEAEAMTERDWRQRLAAVHPDRGGDHEAFVAMTVARAAWKQAQPRQCAMCPRLFAPNKYLPKQQCCGRMCANRFKAAQRKKPARLKVGG